MAHLALLMRCLGSSSSCRSVRLVASPAPSADTPRDREVQPGPAARAASEDQAVVFRRPHPASLHAPR
jgi:hypothetical protein